MREVAAKSMKLARDLDGMLDEALERDLLIRIGWGRGGDEKPKSGEIGAASHLPKGPRVRPLGDLRQCAGALNNGGTFPLHATSGPTVGPFQRDGPPVIDTYVAALATHRHSSSTTL